jgi:hypothetical protein
MRRLPVLLLTCLFVPAIMAAPLPPTARAEIDVLLARLAASACEFYRNGSWHGAAEAKSHLLGKLRYLEGKGLVQSTEQFIELGASKSSVSGEPYRVKCANGIVVNSNAWLRSELQAMRSAERTPAIPGPAMTAPTAK